MRLLIVPLCLFAAGSARVCDSEDKAGATGSASASAQGAVAGAGAVKAALTRPRIGGSMAAAGDYSVELALHEGGRVEALISDVKGALVSAGAKLSALVQAKGGASEEVELAFVPARGRFEGRAKAGVELAPGPVDLTLDIDGKAHAGKLHAGVVVPRPKLGGHVLAAGDFSAELFARPSGEVRAFVRDSAGAEVKGDAGASFKARCRAKGGASEEIALSFEPARASFAGKAKAGVELEPGPLELVAEAKAGAGAAVGRLESIALEVDASHGGQLIAAGDFTVELVAKGNELSAFVFDASGKAHAAGDLDLKLDVGADAATNLALKWDAPSLSYKASFSGKGDLSLQPIRLALVAAGKAHFGAITSLHAAAKANLNAKAKLDADLDAKAKLGADAKAKLDANAKLDPKLDAKAKASLEKGASAKVSVTPPKVSVSTKQEASAGAKAGGGAKASAGISFGTK